MKKLLFCIFSACISVSAIAQKFTISGSVTDEKTGEKIIGANIYDLRTRQGTTSNSYGFYSLTLPQDSVQLVISIIGYQPLKYIFYLNKNTEISPKLKEAVNVKETEVVGDRKIKETESTRMSTIEVPIQQIKKMPALFGEVDVLKALQRLPGVQSGSEGMSGLYIRGGSPDQNLLLLDDAPVYNASHLFGFFSVFNADAIKNVELTKGGFPARYGGRLSSVVDIRMKEGNKSKLGGEASIGIIASKVTIEGPLVNDRTSFIVSGRRTYIDLLMRPLMPEGASFGYYFYDVNAKLNHIISQKDHVYLSVYTGQDKFYLREELNDLNQGISSSSKADFGLGWGNITSTARWNHIINNKMFSNLIATYSRYRFATGVDMAQKTQSSSQNYSVQYYSGIQDYNLKLDLDYLPSPKHYIKFGGSDVLHTFTPGAFDLKFVSQGTTRLDTTISNSLLANEFYLYAEDDWTINDQLKINGGLHYSGFVLKEKYYQSIQPRIAFRMALDSNWTLKGSYASMAQYIHLLTNVGISFPTDLWVPSTTQIKPQFCQQYSLGLARELYENKMVFTIEGYYKYLQNVVEYSEGSSFFNPEANWEKKVEQGKGWTYGIEFFLHKKTGKTNGWLGYTLAWNNRQFDNLNFGEVFPYKYDRRHDFTFVISHEFSDNIQFSATWVYGTGNALTLPTARYLSASPFTGPVTSQQEIEYIASRNSFRMPAYHRMDVGISFKKQLTSFERTWNISIYNFYNRQNPYFLYFNVNNMNQKGLYQVSLFPFLPSVSYSIKF